MSEEDKYSIGHAKCRESLICMINKKLSKNIAVIIAIAVIGVPSVFILYGMAAEKVQNDKMVSVEKQVQVHAVKQDTILFNQRLFRIDMNKRQEENKKELDKLHDKMESDKRDIIKEIRRLHK